MMATTAAAATTTTTTAEEEDRWGTNSEIQRLLGVSNAYPAYLVRKGTLRFKLNDKGKRLYSIPDALKIKKAREDKPRQHRDPQPPARQREHREGIVSFKEAVKIFGRSADALRYHIHQRHLRRVELVDGEAFFKREDVEALLTRRKVKYKLKKHAKKEITAPKRAISLSLAKLNQSLTTAAEQEQVVAQITKSFIEAIKIQYPYVVGVRIDLTAERPTAIFEHKKVNVVNLESRP